MRLASPQPAIPLKNQNIFSIKLLTSPNLNNDKCQGSRLSLNIFYFVTRDSQKASGLEIEFMLDWRAS